MELKITLNTKMNKPTPEVFNAICDGEQITRYFTNKSSGPIEEGKTIQWFWKDYGEHPVKIKQVIPNKKIVFEWDSVRDKGRTQVQMDLESLGANQTNLKITEKGWSPTQNGLDDSYSNCSGWQSMSLCLKAYLEHGIDLRNT